MPPADPSATALFPEPASNGQAAPSRDAVERALLTGKPAEGYRPTLPGHLFTHSSTLLPPLPQFYRDLPAMLACGSVAGPLNNFMSGLAGAQFEVTASSPAVQAFAEQMIDRFWDRSLGQVQQTGYPWGWGGFAPRYTVEDGLLSFDGLYDFDPNDVRPLSRDGVYVGLRVLRGLPGGPADLWGGHRAPPKGFWYTHWPRCGLLYGRSQVYAAHRPWRRLEGRDGADEITDAGVYRFAYRGPVVRFPSDQPPARAQQTQQGVREPNRELALQTGEALKAGANVALSGDRDAKGDYKWGVDFPDHVLDVAPLLEYAGSLEDRISLAIGWSPELTQASETGSGYSGRNVPKEIYQAGQHRLGKSVLGQFKEQLLDPLITWNFGRRAWCHVKLKPLAQPAQPGAAAGQGGAGQTIDAADARLRDRSPRPPAAGLKPLSNGRQLATDPPAALKLADDVAESITREAATALAKRTPRWRRRLLKALTAAGTAAERLARAWVVLDECRAAFARSLGGARLAAALAGMGRVVAGLPARQQPQPTGPPSPPGPDAALGDALAGLPAAAREAVLTALMPDRRAAVEKAVTTVARGPIPPVEPPFDLTALADGPPDVHLPLVEAAADDLRRRGVFTRGEFDALEARARADAFTVAGLESKAAIGKVRDLLADFTEGTPGPGFRQRVKEAVGEGTFFSDAHLETVFRTSVNAALSDGQQRILDNPMVGDHFPYRAVYPIHDDRVRPWHLATETHGLDGTNVYPADSEVWQAIRPVADFGCRCGWAPLTVEMAAAAGVKEAQRWLETGTPPAEHGPVSLPPDWQQSPGFRRLATAFDPAEARDPAGRWTRGHKARRVGRSYLAMAAGVPAAAMESARGKVADAHAKLSARYGRRYAAAIVAAGLAGLPVPVPGASLMAAAPLVAVAELHRRLSRAVA